jgi:hypothetical protein
VRTSRHPDLVARVAAELTRPTEPFPPQGVTSELSQTASTMPYVTADYREFVNRTLSLIERGCRSKAAFVSRREARAVSRHGRHANGQLAPYHCGWCQLWHVGHRRRRRRQ